MLKRGQEGKTLSHIRVASPAAPLADTLQYSTLTQLHTRSKQVNTVLQ